MVCVGVKTTRTRLDQALILLESAVLTRHSGLCECPTYVRTPNTLHRTQLYNSLSGIQIFSTLTSLYLSSSTEVYTGVDQAHVAVLYINITLHHFYEVLRYSTQIIYI